MVTSIEKLVYQSVLLVGEPRLEITWLLSFHARGTPTIMVRTFITLKDIFCTSEAKERMFIILDGPPKAGEGIVVLINYNTLVLVVKPDLPNPKILFSCVCTPGVLYTCSPFLGGRRQSPR